MTVAEPNLEDVIGFVRNFTRVGGRKFIESSTRLEADLRVTGDDGIELLAEAEKKFGVSFGGTAGLRALFDLGPDEYLFGAEGVAFCCSRGRPRPAIQDPTIGALHTAICRRRKEA